MRRNFLFGLIVVLIPTLLAGAFVGLGFYRESQGQAGFRRGIDLAGGTILVYEVNLERTKQRLGTAADATDPGATAGLSSDDIKKLAESLKRRIDPADLRNVIVRPVGTTRVEIILPFSGSTTGEKAGVTEDFVQEVKNLVSQVGVLEFRIVANPTDDAEAIEDTRAYFARVEADPALKAEFESLAKRGLPPPFRRVDGSTATYKVTVNGQAIEGTTYEWVELGREQRETLGLSNAYGTDNPPKNRDGTVKDGLFHNVALSRGKLWPPTGGAYLLYSRDHIETTPSKDEDGKKVEYFMLTRISPVDSLRVDSDVGLQASVGTRGLDPAVNFQFNATGANRFGKMTERNRKSGSFKRQLAVIMDEKIVSAPTLDAVIRDRGDISGSFDQGSVIRLANIMKSGALNAELKPDPVSENTVGPTLGQDTIRKGLWAVGLAFGAVLAFMVVYYRFAGLVACIALFLNLLLTVGFMVFANAAFTLPGLAGVVLMLGMAVDANVLIYERIREEREKGANLATAIRLGYDRAFATIIDTHLTSIFTCIVLYTFGNDNLKGFAVSLTVGLVISLFTSLYVTRLMFDYWQHKRWLSTLRMMRLFARPSFDFMKIRVPMFILTAALTILGLALFLYRGNDGLNVDFTKGALYGGRLKDDQARTMSELLALLGENAQKDRLKVDDVVWLGAPTTTDDGRTTVAAWIYQIKYAAGTSGITDNTAIVTISPDPAWIALSEDARRADLIERAAKLPGLSVEQVKLSEFDGDLSGGKTRSFAVRTTEKEPELVQVMLDRLLRDKGEQLLVAAKIVDTKVAGSVATLTLDRPASPKYFTQFVLRELKLENRVPTVGGSPAVEVTGVQTVGDQAVAITEERTGRYKTLRIDVSQNPEFRALKEFAESDSRAALFGPAALVKPAALRETDVFAKTVTAAGKAFEARPVPDRLETFDPALAADTRNRAFYAILLSWVVILGYLWFRFGNWTFGLAAVICLVHDLAFTLGMIAVCHYLYDNPFGQLLGLHDFKIDLAAVAALLTLVGYSVNDTIVVFDRIREVRGKNPALTPQMINDSVNQTLSRTVLASLTVFLVVGVLYFFGGEGVHLFAFVMVVGVLVGTYSSIYIASPLLLLFGEGKGRVSTTEPKPTTTAPTEAKEEELVV